MRPVVYVRDDSLALCDFSSFVPQHAMKPWRVQAVNELVDGLPSVRSSLVFVRPPSISLDELLSYHSPEYIRRLCLHNKITWHWHPACSDMTSFTADCPPVEGIVEFSAAAAAGSLLGAILLNTQQADVVINWNGGLHHAKCGDCAGFCYVNDVVLSILELLRHHERVLYVDLDVHHGDGVEEAFYLTNRVFTLSLHKFGGGFFPGTGSALDVGLGAGRFHSMNLPCFDGIDDDAYTAVFSCALRNVVAAFAPQVVVLQCGADSLAGDRVGTFNLSSIGHSRCVAMCANLGLPLLALGGGGYVVKNVAKLWSYETAILAGHRISPFTLLPCAAMPTASWLFEPGSTFFVPNDEIPPHPRRNALVVGLLKQIERHAHRLFPPPSPCACDVSEESETVGGSEAERIPEGPSAVAQPSDHLVLHIVGEQSQSSMTDAAQTPTPSNINAPQQTKKKNFWDTRAAKARQIVKEFPGQSLQVTRKNAIKCAACNFLIDPSDDTRLRYRVREHCFRNKQHIDNHKVDMNALFDDVVSKIKNGSIDSSMQVQQLFVDRGIANVRMALKRFYFERRHTITQTRPRTQDDEGKLKRTVRLEYRSPRKRKRTKQYASATATASTSSPPPSLELDGTSSVSTSQMGSRTDTDEQSSS